YSSCHHRYLPSFPTRRSSDLFGRAMTDRDFEALTLAMAHNAQKASATDYVAAQISAFQISRGLATFFEAFDVFLCPTLCSPPVRSEEHTSELQSRRDLVCRLL